MLTDSMFVICGDGYNGVADTLDEAHALALRMDGGTVYVKVDLVEHILTKMDTVVDKAERIVTLEMALRTYAQHGRYCAALGYADPYGGDGMTSCTCGLSVVWPDQRRDDAHQSRTRPLSRHRAAARRAAAHASHHAP
jgi:hypothetical protein